ncbi:MAG: hypothetical protein A2Y53_06915 [Chloroflexi bacterium RBG_16_47_49]|nr:MAG: hypothetical protein A2Y53_06915 [Chloroflexi bacterium RBG_16_47_49]
MADVADQLAAQRFCLFQVLSHMVKILRQLAQFIHIVWVLTNQLHPFVVATSRNAAAGLQQSTDWGNDLASDKKNYPNCHSAGRQGRAFRLAEVGGLQCLDEGGKV